MGFAVEFTATDCGATVAAVDVVVEEDVEVDVWVADPRLMCKFFLAISALSTVPFSWSIFLPLRTSIASRASRRVRNLANPI